MHKKINFIKITEMQDPTEKHSSDVGILDKYEINNNNN